MCTLAPDVNSSMATGFWMEGGWRCFGETEAL